MYGSLSVLQHHSSLWISGARIFILTLLYAPITQAASVILTWDANKEADIAGYNIYQRTLPSTDYGSPIYSGLPPNPSAPQLTITNLLEGRSYGFIATAFDAAGNESAPSLEKLMTMSGIGGGTTTNISSFPPPMSSPAPGTTLTTSTVTFSGAHSTQDLEHKLRIGRTNGGSDLLNASLGSTHSVTASGLPTTGTIYVWYWTRNSTGWFVNKSTFTMRVR